VHKIFVTRDSLVFDLTATRYQLVSYQFELLTRRARVLINSACPNPDTYVAGYEIRLNNYLHGLVFEMDRTVQPVPNRSVAGPWIVLCPTTVRSNGGSVLPSPENGPCR
jgi:hypothetical protein